MATKASDRDALVGLLGPVVSDSGLDLEDVVVTPAGKRRLVRVVVDQDGGVGLDTVARVSTAVSARGFRDARRAPRSAAARPSRTALRSAPSSR